MYAQTVENTDNFYDMIKEDQILNYDTKNLMRDGKGGRCDRDIELPIIIKSRYQTKHKVQVVICSLPYLKQNDELE